MCQMAFSEGLDNETGYPEAQRAVAAATDAMRASDLLPDDKKRYDRTHKQMLRFMRDWNKIEHAREAG